MKDIKRRSGYTIPLSNFSCVEKGKTKIYYWLSNTNSDTFDFSEKLSAFHNPNTIIVYIRWVETYSLYRYRESAKKEFKNFCDINSVSGIVIAEPGYIKLPMTIEEATIPGEQVTIGGYEHLYTLFRPLEMTRDEKEEVAKQIYFLEMLGFKDTGYRSACGNNIYIYKSDLSKKYLMNLIMNEL